jgi:hypothetical protein
VAVEKSVLLLRVYRFESKAIDTPTVVCMMPCAEDLLTSIHTPLLKLGFAVLQPLPLRASAAHGAARKCAFPSPSIEVAALDLHAEGIPVPPRTNDGMSEVGTAQLQTLV